MSLLWLAAFETRHCFMSGFCWDSKHSDGHSQTNSFVQFWDCVLLKPGPRHCNSQTKTVITSCYESLNIINCTHLDMMKLYRKVLKVWKPSQMTLIALKFTENHGFHEFSQKMANFMKKNSWLWWHKVDDKWRILTDENIHCTPVVSNFSFL